jgi:hypothetical protein
MHQQRRHARRRQYGVDVTPSFVVNHRSDRGFHKPFFRLDAALPGK